MVALSIRKTHSRRSFAFPFPARPFYRPTTWHPRNSSIYKASTLAMYEIKSKTRRE